MDKFTLQLILAAVITVAGLCLLFFGLFMPPTGVIDNSVLVAFGEASTFAGALLGVDYNYKFRIHELNTRSREHVEKKEANA
ncbi:MAG: hypothetical protein IKE76_09575 [Clostridia bacterium]|nr:hypothetical protein [Clostridia bacterium]